MDVRAVAFDAFGTLVQIGDRRSPYRRLMRWMHENGRKPTRDDAARIMSHAGGLADKGSSLQCSCVTPYNRLPPQVGLNFVCVNADIAA